MKKETRKYRITLKDIKSGFSRTFKEEYEIDEDGDDVADYIWNEGNYSCDCNRSLFLWNWKKKALSCNTDEKNQKIKLMELLPIKKKVKSKK